MRSTHEALSLLLDSVGVVGVERVDTSNVNGRVAAEDVLACAPSPAFDNSSMDGFAVSSSDTSTASREKPKLMRVAINAKAGQTSYPYKETDEAARIMTGGAMPAGADAVVPVEDTDQDFSSLEEALPEHVAIFRAVDPGEYVRKTGEDFMPGATLIRKGTRITPRHYALLISGGVERIHVFRRLRVALFSSGDELKEAGEPLQHGQIYDTNRAMLAGLMTQSGVEALDLGIAPDRLEDVQARLERALEQDVDLILSSAGVSVGVYDFVRVAVEQHGEITAWRVNMRPGKPFAFGHYRNTPFVGLPGNPASAFVGYEVFLRPLLHHMGGQTDWSRRTLTATLTEDLTSDGRESYLRATLHHEDGAWQATLSGHQGSSNLYGLTQANALVIVPAGVQSLQQGSQVTAWPLT